MGVVRREGDWRLEKQRDGVYEITYEKRTEAKVITSDYNPKGFTDERNDFSIPVREVESFSDVEDIFKQMAQMGSSTGGFGGSFGEAGGTSGLTEEDGDLSDLPPGGTIIVGFVGGAYVISQTGFNVQSPLFVLGGGLIALGLVVVLLTVRVLNSEGPAAAVDYLISGRDDASTKTEGKSTGDSTSTTPPAPEDLKNRLYFERADKKCEWCGETVDAPDVHHITPRNEGGPNESDNLIVLCPNCHRKADRGVISRSKLRYQIGS